MNAIADGPHVLLDASLPKGAVAGTSPEINKPMPAEYLSFRLGAEEYAIDILTVQEIRSNEAPTRLAGTRRRSSKAW